MKSKVDDFQCLCAKGKRTFIGSLIIVSLVLLSFTITYWQKVMVSIRKITLPILSRWSKIKVPEVNHLLFHLTLCISSPHHQTHASLIFAHSGLRSVGTRVLLWFRTVDTLENLHPTYMNTLLLLSWKFGKSGRAQVHTVSMWGARPNFHLH